MIEAKLREKLCVTDTSKLSKAQFMNHSTNNVPMLADKTTCISSRSYQKPLRILQKEINVSHH